MITLSNFIWSLSFLNGAVTWTIIQLAAKSHRNSTDYQNSFTCKFVRWKQPFTYFSWYFLISSYHVCMFVNKMFLWTCSLLDNNKLSGYLPPELSRLPNLLILYYFLFSEYECVHIYESILCFTYEMKILYSS
jgi:hypothetical protein